MSSVPPGIPGACVSSLTPERITGRPVYTAAFRKAWRVEGGTVVDPGDKELREWAKDLAEAKEYADWKHIVFTCRYVGRKPILKVVDGGRGFYLKRTSKKTPQDDTVLVPRLTDLMSFARQNGFGAVCLASKRHLVVVAGEDVQPVGYDDLISQ